MKKLILFLLIIILSINIVNATDFTTNIYASWNFNTSTLNSTYYLDTSGNGYHTGTIGSTTNQTVYIGYGVWFNNVNDYVSLPANFLDHDTDWSVSFFYNMTDGNDGQRMFSERVDNNLIIQYDGANSEIDIYAGGSWHNGVATGIGTNELHHIGLTHDDATSLWIVYDNGVQASNFTQTGNAGGQATTLRRIGYPSEGIRNGYIDEMAVWSGRILTETEFNEIYTSGVTYPYITSSPAVNTTYFDITTSNGIQTFEVEYQTGASVYNLNTTNGTIATGINQSLGTMLSYITIIADNHFTYTITNYNSSNDLTATLGKYPAIYSYDWINETNITNINLNFNGTIYNGNTVFVPYNESKIFSTNITGYINETFTMILEPDSIYKLNLTLIERTLNFIALDIDNNTLSNPYFNITSQAGQYENIGNPTQVGHYTYINYTNQTQNITITVQDLDNYMQDKTITYIINKTTRNITINLIPNELLLFFTDVDGNDINVYGELTNEGSSFYFNSTNFTFYQQNLSIGNVYIKLTINESKPFTQFYEYYNDYSNHIVQNITMLTDATLLNFSVKVVGNTKNPLDGAIVQQYVVKPLFLVFNENLFLGQRIAKNGITDFYIGDKDQNFIVSKDGYSTLQSKTYSFINLMNYGHLNPLELILTGGGITQQRGLTIIIPQYTKNKSVDIPIYIHSPISSDIEVRTLYMMNQQLVKKGLAETSTNDMYYTLLESGTHFSSGEGNVTIYIFKDNVLHTTFIVYDKTNEQNTNLFVKPEGINEKTLLVIFTIMIVLLSGFVGAKFDYEDAGIFAFYTLALIMTLFNATFIWIVIIPFVMILGKKLLNMGGDNLT